MAILKVARIGHPAVRTVATAVSPEVLATPAMQRFIDDMRQTMYEYDGVGLAAPQVHECVRLAVMEVRDSDERAAGGVPFTVLVNPVLTPLGPETLLGWEGCLSVPDLRGTVPRFARVRLEALDREGRPLVVEAEGFHARVLQHECDHLDGRVYLDRMTDLRSLTFLKEFQDHVARRDDEE